MDEATRQMVGACYIAVCDAAGIGVLDTANATLMDAVENGGISDPEAREAITVLVRSCEPDTAPDVVDAMADVEDDAHRLQLIAQLNTVVTKMSASVDAVAAATGNESLGRLMGYLKRRAAKVNLSTPLEDIMALSDMADAIGGELARMIKATSTKVDA